MENYTLDDIKTFLKRKGYTWSGKIWENGSLPQKVNDVAELYGRTKPIILFDLQKGEEEVLQYISVFDTRFEFWQEAGLGSAPLTNDKKFNHSRFILQDNYSSEWADFLAERHNHLGV